MPKIFPVSSLLLALILTLTAHAHDPYEITSVAYLHTNRMELFVELEFVTALKLAGVEPRRDTAVTTQFEAAQRQLRDLAGNFFNFTAGHHAVLPLRTNVELAVEDHVQLKLEFAPTAYRPLRFTARGLANVDDSSYGTTLTVLDMVNQKVLGQTTLFASSPPADFPPQTSLATADDPNEPPPADPNSIASDSTIAPEPDADANAPTPPASPVRASRLSFIITIGIAAFAFVILSAWRNRR